MRYVGSLVTTSDGVGASVEGCFLFGLLLMNVKFTFTEDLGSTGFGEGLGASRTAGFSFTGNVRLTITD